MITINIGNVPNDGLGDKVRDAFNKVNQNFTEVTNTKADLLNGRVNPEQLPQKTVSLTVPSGVPNDGDEWILYTL